MKDKLLQILNEDAHLTSKELAERLRITPEEVDALVAELKQEGVILGSKTVINWENSGKELTTALIEVRVTPQRGRGFDRIAHRLYQYPQVNSCYLMSGGFDLMLILEGKTLRDIAQFVAEKIAPVEYVLSTSTHFILKKYKNDGTIFALPNEDDREAIVL